MLRFVNLGRPDAIIFDETYYVKDALALLRFGYERQAVDGADDKILAQDAAWNQLDIFKDAPSFVVHPPLGKWVIAAGEWAFGVTPFGWRFGVAVLGTLSVLMTARIIRRLTRSDLVGTVAGLLVALDGLHIVMSRTALLDMTLMFFVLAAFGFLLLDRDAVRRRADAWRTLWEGNPVILGPGFGLRPWRIAAGVSLGLACGVKWSGLWYVAFFGLLTVYWDLQLRRELGAGRPLQGVLVRDALPGVPEHRRRRRSSPTWSPGPGGWSPTAGTTATGPRRTPGWPLVPDALRSLAEYHRAAWAFHVGLDSPHSYKSSAWSWPVMSRPTSFYYESPEGACGADRCAEEVLALGNPIIWWAGLLALVPQRLARRGRARLAQRRPARRLPGRLAAVDGLPRPDHLHVLRDRVRPLPRGDAGHLAGQPRRRPGRHARRAGSGGSSPRGRSCCSSSPSTWFFLPIWTGQVLPYAHWDWRMWLPTWV